MTDPDPRDEEIAALRAVIESLHAENEEQRTTIELLQRDFRGKLLRIRSLEADLAKATEDETSDEAKAVFEFWRALLAPGAKKFTAKRQKAVNGRLKEGWSVEELQEAIRGAQIGAFVDENGQRHDDLELICRDDQYVRRFVGIWRRHHRRALEQGEERYQRLQAMWTGIEPVLTVEAETGRLVQATPPPLHVRDPRSPAERIFDATILRHMTIARLRIPAGLGHVETEEPEVLVEMEQEAQARAHEAAQLELGMSGDEERMSA